jgi:hypothetical protein
MKPSSVMTMSINRPVVGSSTNRHPGIARKAPSRSENRRWAFSDRDLGGASHALKKQGESGSLIPQANGLVKRRRTKAVHVVWHTFWADCPQPPGWVAVFRLRPLDRSKTIARSQHAPAHGAGTAGNHSMPGGG